MLKAGSTYTITLKKSHLEWGTHRYTGSRNQIYGEGYIPIPSHIAYNYNLLNNNGTNYTDVLGKNLFNCTSVDGKFSGILRAQGSREAGDIYAKQFSGDKDLKSLGDWYYAIGASIGDQVKVTWISLTDIEIEKM